MGKLVSLHGCNPCVSDAVGSNPTRPTKQWLGWIMVNPLDCKSSAAGCVGSTPTLTTKNNAPIV